MDGLGRDGVGFFHVRNLRRWWILCQIAVVELAKGLPLILDVIDHGYEEIV
jgi:hypothetical protein